jgi:hypothetical protein
MQMRFLLIVAIPLAISSRQTLAQFNSQESATSTNVVTQAAKEKEARDAAAVGLTAAEWEDHVRWWKSPEKQAFGDEMIGLEKRAEARGSLTTNEAATLIAYMQNPRYDMRNLACLAASLGRTDPAKSMLMPSVLNLLNDRTAIVRMAAARTLGIIGDKTDVPHLEPLLNDKSEYVVKNARQAISKLQQTEAVPTH